MHKAMSPLLGAPLLILLTVSVAILISGWSLDFFKEQSGSIQNKTHEELTCEYATTTPAHQAVFTI